MKPYFPPMPKGSEWADELDARFWERLRARPVAETAAATGAELGGGRFVLPVFATHYTVNPEERTVREIDRPRHRVDYNTALVLVDHLARAQNAPPAGRMVAPSELPGGDALVNSPHALPIAFIEDRFGKDAEAMLRQAQELGGRSVDGADVAVALPGLPKLDLYLLLWLADDEFPASATFGVDAHALHQLSMDALISLAHLAIQRMTEA